METQGNSLCSYLNLKVAKTLGFSFYLSSFFFHKIGEQEVRTGSAWGKGMVGTYGSGERWGKG
jgi:hypothetical protein